MFYTYTLPSSLPVLHVVNRQADHLRAPVVLHSSRGSERRRLLPQMAPAAHPCHHLRPWYMAGLSFYLFSVIVLFKIMLMYLRFAVVGWTLIFVFLWRWNGVSGRCSWSLSWTNSRLLSPSLCLWSKIMLEANTHTLLVYKSILLLWSGQFFFFSFVFQYNHLLQFRKM